MAADRRYGYTYRPLRRQVPTTDTVTPTDRCGDRCRHSSA